MTYANSIQPTTVRTTETGEMSLGQMAELTRNWTDCRQAEELQAEWDTWEETNAWATDTARAGLELQMLRERMEESDRQTALLLESLGL